MLYAMQKIQSFIDGIGFDRFKNDEKTRDAVIRNFEIIGEAANQVPEKLKNNYPDIPWKEMYGLRNIVSHHYFGIDYSLIWKIAAHQLPDNQRDLEELIESEETDNC
jgi:uncharacterized protein with HEPN domain